MRALLDDAQQAPLILGPAVTATRRGEAAPCGANPRPSGPSRSHPSSPSWASAWWIRSSNRSPTTSTRRRPQVSLLFTSYMAVMGVAMLITGVVSSRIGPKRTLLLGLLVIIVGSGPGRHVGHRRADRRVARRCGALATRCSSRPRWPPSSTRPAARWPRRSSSTRPPSASASPWDRWSAGYSGRSRGADRSSAFRR